LTTGAVRAAAAAASSLVAVLALSAFATASHPAAASGNTYYVDQGLEGASDSNPGTETEPWLTIQHAADVALAGDTVIVKSGTYPERVWPAHSGVDGAHITFRAEPRRSVTMWGFYTRDADYVRIEGFSITTDPSLTGWTDRHGVFIRSNHVEVVDNYFYDIDGYGVLGYWHEPYPRSAYVAQNKVYRCQAGINVTGYDWLVEDNEVERLYDHGQGDCDYTRFFGDDHVIRGNYFHGTDFEEIGSAHVDCFQTFDNNGEFVHDVTIESNWCEDFHQGFMGEGHYYHDITRITFKNNVFAHGGAWGLCVQDISYLTAVNNTFVDIRYHAIGVSGQHGHHALIYNNIISGSSSSYWFSDGASGSGDYNLIFDASPPPESGAHDLVGLDPLFEDGSGGDYHLQPGSPAVDAAQAWGSVRGDFDGNERPQGHAWDIGAFEYLPPLTLHGQAGDETIRLDWTVNVTVPATSVWRIDYYSTTIASTVVATDALAGSVRQYKLPGLDNYSWYTVTLSTVPSWLSDTVSLLVTDRFAFLPIVHRGH
jgi:hypothetical protein